MARIVLCDEPTWVYYAYCRHNGLLYVGVAGDVRRRVAQHRKDKAWWCDEVDNLLTQLYPTRQQALAVEAHAIRAYRPLYNRVGQPNCSPLLHEVPPHDWTAIRFLDARGVAV